MISYSSSEMRKINFNFPNLYYSKSAVRGEIDFSVKYELSSGKKHSRIWKIVPCRSGPNCITDVYEIEVRLDDLRENKPRVFEVGGKIKDLAAKINKHVIDLHLYPDGEDCCLGIFLPSRKTLSEFVLNKVYPYFVWQAYYSKYRETPPVGEWTHDARGLEEFEEHLRNIGRNDPCPCASGRKFKACCIHKL